MTNKTENKDKKNTTQNIKQIWTTPTQPKPRCNSGDHERKTFVTCIDFIHYGILFSRHSFILQYWKRMKIFPCLMWLMVKWSTKCLFAKLTYILTLVKLSFRIAVTKPPPWVVWIICRFWKKRYVRVHTVMITSLVY